jgi:hypothetical protein
MNKYQIHADTATASNVQTYTGQIGQASVYKVNGNPFQCTIILGNRHRAVRSVSLKDAQIPIGFYNIRAPYNTVTINSIVYTIPPGNYNITSLVNTLNSTITNAVGMFGTSPTTNQMQFSAGAMTTAIFSVTPLSLGAFLGFTNGQSGTYITSTNSYIVNFDTCLYVWISEVGTSSLDGQQITYKVPIIGGSGSIVQYTEGSNWNQKVIFTDRSNRLDRLTVRIVDRFGNIINNNGLDWTFTLEIDADN